MWAGACTCAYERTNWHAQDEHLRTGADMSLHSCMSQHGYRQFICALAGAGCESLRVRVYVVAGVEEVVMLACLFVFCTYL